MATAILAESVALPRILVVDPDPGEHLEPILSRGGCSVAVAAHAAEIAPALADHRPEVVFQYKMTGFTGAPTATVLGAPELRWLHYAGVGLDHLAGWDEARVMVSNSAGVLSDFMAEYVMAAILSANIGFPDYARRQAKRRWEPSGWLGIKGKTLVIVGLGRIGSTVAARAKAFGMRTIGIRSRPEATPGLDEVLPNSALPHVIAEADFVSIHVPLTSATTGLFGAEMLARLKPSAILVNTSRGGVVDERALAQRLRTGQLRAAISDVFATEPLSKDNPLWDVPNLTITPHMSDSVSDWKFRSAMFFLESLTAYIGGRQPPNVVSPRRGY